MGAGQRGADLEVRKPDGGDVARSFPASPGDGMVHQRTAAVGGQGCKRRAVCKNVSRSTDACDRLKLSGIASG